MNRFLAISFILVAFVLGAGAGYSYAPEYRMETKQMPGLGEPGKGLDLAYLNLMAAHHREAMLLAQQAGSQSRRPEIQSLAAEILRNEPGLIEELYAWKKAWYGDRRKAKDPTADNLGVFDENFDLRFLNALIAHHSEGIAMAQDVRRKSFRNEVLNNADSVERFLSKSLETLKSWRFDWYGIN